MSQMIHLYLNVRGVLLNWSDDELHGMLVRDGRALSAHEIKEALLDELIKGHKVIPLGPACEGFDYAGGGCPGHEVVEEATP